MAEITAKQVAELRSKTGAGLIDCKRALTESGGDFEVAIDVLRKKGVAMAAQKAGRDASEGIIAQCLADDGRSGVLVELNCETDFVSRTTEFKELAHNLAMQIAAMAPQYVDQTELAEDSGENPEEVCLLQQPYIKDPGRVIEDLVTDLTARIGENVRVKRFARFELGEE